MNQSFIVSNGKGRRALEGLYRDNGIPTRRGRRQERRSHTTPAEERRRARLLEEQTRGLRRRPPPPRPVAKKRRGRRTALQYVGRPNPGRRVVVVACALESCGKMHTQRRPVYQTRPGQPDKRRASWTVPFLLRDGFPAYCCPRHRWRAAWERRRARTRARRLTWTTCEWCGRRITAQPMRADLSGPRCGRPRRFCNAYCRQRAYRAAHPAAPQPFAVYPIPCRDCGARIAASGRPGRPPSRCATCRVTIPAKTEVSFIPAQQGLLDLDVQVQETEERRRADPEYAEWLRRNPGRR